MRVGNRFLQLIRDRLRIGRTVPAVVHIGAECFGVASRQFVFWLGKSTDVDLSHCASMSRKLLRQRNGSDDLMIFVSTGRNDSGNVMALVSEFDQISWSISKLRSQSLSHKQVLRTILWPNSLHLPPRMRPQHTDSKILLSIS